jgi:hypothetical protein
MTKHFFSGSIGFGKARNSATANHPVEARSGFQH